MTFKPLSDVSRTLNKRLINPALNENEEIK